MPASDPRAPEALDKALADAERAAMEYEETSHLDDQEKAIAKKPEDEPSSL